MLVRHQALTLKKLFPDFVQRLWTFLHNRQLVRRRTAMVELLVTVSLTPRASLTLIRFDRERLLLGITENSITLLAKSSATVDLGCTESREEVSRL
jgi:flagellar biogenesis protein FliO